MKAIGYIRCSTQEQADSGLGLDAQAERIRAYAALKGLNLDIITDPGESGGKPLDTREGGQRLLAALRQRKADAVVLLKLDRGFRNAIDCLSTVEKWEKAGVSLHIVDLGGNAIDTTSAAGRFMLVVLAGERRWSGTSRGNGHDRQWPSNVPTARGSAPFRTDTTWVTTA